MTSVSIMTSGVALAALLVTAAAPAQAITPEGPAQHCRRVGTDDTVLPYAPVLKSGYVLAFRRLFPKAPPPGDDELRTASLRCLDGRLLACFTGANLPCARIRTERRNPGAEAFCRENPDAAVVPLVATGHDVAFSYGCRSGRAEVTGPTFELDARGFAKALWAPID